MSDDTPVKVPLFKGTVNHFIVPSFWINIFGGWLPENLMLLRAEIDYRGVSPYDKEGVTRCVEDIRRIISYQKDKVLVWPGSPDSGLMERVVSLQTGKTTVNANK